MSKPLLSILIPTVVGREDSLNGLLNEVTRQLPDWYGDGEVEKGVNMFGFDSGSVEIICCKDSKEMTIGEKRERLYAMANGLYSLQIDDDDLISDDAIGLILEAIKSNPEIPCITFREKCLINGDYFSSNHSIKYDKWHDNYDGYSYVRTPFYKDVIRTNLAQSVPFEKIRWNEDERWSYAIQPLLIDEIHIDEELYYYIHNSTDTKERYGFDRDETSNSL